MIYETEHFLVRCNKAHFINNKTEFDDEVRFGVVVEKKYPTEIIKICDVIYDEKEAACMTVFTDNSLVDNILDWPDYQEFAQVLDEANYLVMLANKMREYTESLD